ncbi:MAG: hypothetical protein CVV50_01565, partial [Spirochaetae bacterium HGW-Spirochaetae-6]
MRSFTIPFIIIFLFSLLSCTVPSDSNPETPAEPTQVEAPELSLPSGTTSATAITLEITTATPGASIRYILTDDNSEPADPSNSSGEPYTAPLVFSTDNIYKIKAIAYKDGMTSSSVSPTYTYTKFTSIDTTAPIPGGSGILTFTSTDGSTGVQLNWQEATDNQSSPTNLKYKIVQSTVDNLNSIEEAESTGDGRAVIFNWGIRNVEQTKFYLPYQLNTKTKYYYAVLVKDEAGNKAIYSPNNYTTTDTIYISSSGSDYIFGNQAKPLKTLTMALSLASPGTIIKVAAGYYTANLAMKSGVTLLGGYNLADWNDRNYSDRENPTYKTEITGNVTFPVTVAATLEGFYVNGKVSAEALSVPILRYDTINSGYS